MKSTTPRFDATFESTLPKAFFSKAPQTIKPSTSADWRSLGTVIVLSLTLVAVVAIITPRQRAATLSREIKADAQRPEDLGAIPVNPPPPAPPPAPALPEVRRAEALPFPVPRANVVPRAQLIHVRGIDTVEHNRMPDGRLLTTTYKGELSTVGHLPTRGAQLGDMWFTRNDGHCWVLAPVTAGSSTVGWVDP